MNRTRQEPCQKAPQGVAKGLGHQAANAVARDLDPLSPYCRSSQFVPIAGEGIMKNASLGDILVDVDAGSEGTALVIWIVGG